LFLQLNEVTRKEIAEVDMQLTAKVQARLLQKQEAQKTVKEKVDVSQAEKQFQDNDKDTLEALNKLREMQMD
jgi:hypothetical protein